MACPDENLIAGYVRGGLDPPSYRSVADHLDVCESCTLLVAELGRVMVTPSADALGLPRSAIDARPDRAGRYELEDILGSGGWGTVYRARDPELGRAVAVKVVRHDLARDPAAADKLQARLLREARAMAQVAHPNVVPIFEVQSVDRVVFLVMELVPGTTLRVWLAQGRKPREVLRMFLEVGEGLEAAHAFGVVHRDFKPDNVLVGLDSRPRITDFGLAIAALPGAGHREVAGTPAYAAPEQIFGHPVDGRADQFAFAASLYEALYGIPPFERGPIDRMRWVYATARARPPPSIRGLGAGLAPVLLRALSLQPEHRYPTMRALLAALHHASHADELLHVRINATIQGVATVAHLAVLIAWVRRADAPAAAATVGETTRTTPSDPSTLDLMMGAGLVMSIIIGAGWVVLGVVWAPFNAWALLTRRRFGRISTLIYAGLSILSCIGIPYAIYAIWSLTRPHVKALFAISPLGDTKR